MNLSSDVVEDLLSDIRNYEGPVKKKTKCKVRYFEPKFYDMLIRPMESKKILQVNPKSDSCKQACEKAKADWCSMSNEEFKTIDFWDGDIIFSKLYTGLIKNKDKTDYLLHAIDIIQEGHYVAVPIAIRQLCSYKHYNILQLVKPTRIYCSLVAPLISKNGSFEDSTLAFREGWVWLVWYAKEDNTIRKQYWLKDLLDYYILDETGIPLKRVISGSSTRIPIYKKPIQIELYKN